MEFVKSKKEKNLLINKIYQFFLLLFIKSIRILHVIANISKYCIYKFFIVISYFNIHREGNSILLIIFQQKMTINRVLNYYIRSYKYSICNFTIPNN